MKQFLYLIQGRRKNVILYQHLQSATSDLIALTFDHPLENDLEAIEKIYLPNSTWAEGRNLQLETAKELKQQYLYYIFIDDDVEFINGSFGEYQRLLLQHQPAVGIPLLTVISRTYRYNPSLKIQHPVAIDQQVQAYHKSVIFSNTVMPLVTDFDKESWWYACEINSFQILSIYRGHVMQFNTLLVDNLGHHWDDAGKLATEQDSNYVGGVTESGLDTIRLFLLDKFGSQPRLRNSLFHDPQFPKFNYLPSGLICIKLLVRYLKQGKFSSIKILFQLFIQNMQNAYPKKDIIFERDFKSIEKLV